MSKAAAWMAAAAVLAVTGIVGAARAEDVYGARSTITERVDDNDRAVLGGNIRPEVATAADRGAVSDDYPMEHMLLQLKRAPELEATLEHTIDTLYDPTSPQFHHWIEPAEFGRRFGLATSDRTAVTRWLTAHGFTVNVDYENGVLIDFSGTAGQVRTAFRTEIHAFDVAGVRHIANVSAPQIPRALAPAIGGVVALHDFKPHSLLRKRPAFSFHCSDGTCHHAVVPGDLATIYNFKPAFAAGYTGKGQTIAVIEDSDVYSTADWATFRKTFALSTAYPSGSLVVVHPSPSAGGTNCTDPGVNGDEDEAALDIDWASAAAPNAEIELASCANSPDGLLIAIQNLTAETTHPSIISVSYGECETYNGAASNLAYYMAFQQAAAEGISVFVSSGDQDAASCDADEKYATHGVGVSGLASTKYNVAVGGTDFGDGVDGTSSSYWATTNKIDHSSVKSYIPEIPWNGSCASQLLATAYGFTTTYGASGFCSSATAKSDGWLEVTGGSGGPSGCAKGTPSTAGLVTGTCAGWAKPVFQSVLGNPADGVRDIPDVSMFASNGIWDEYLIYCDTDNGGLCGTTVSLWQGGGGTSFAAPILAGIQALVNQAQGAAQGNPNPVYYKLARAEYGTAGAASCTAASGKAPASTCVFYDTIRGDIDVNCHPGTKQCYAPSGTQGMLTTHSGGTIIAYGTTKGWDFATGIGTPNVYNLIKNW